MGRVNSHQSPRRAPQPRRIRCHRDRRPPPRSLRLYALAHTACRARRKARHLGARRAGPARGCAQARARNVLGTDPSIETTDSAKCSVQLKVPQPNRFGWASAGNVVGRRCDLARRGSPCPRACDDAGVGRRSSRDRSGYLNALGRADQGDLGPAGRVPDAAVASPVRATLAGMRDVAAAIAGAMLRRAASREAQAGGASASASLSSMRCSPSLTRTA